MGNSHFLNL